MNISRLDHWKHCILKTIDESCVGPFTVAEIAPFMCNSPIHNIKIELYFFFPFEARLSLIIIITKDTTFWYELKDRFYSHIQNEKFSIWFMMQFYKTSFWISIKRPYLWCYCWHFQYIQHNFIDCYWFKYIFN